MFLRTSLVLAALATVAGAQQCPPAGFDALKQGSFELSKFLGLWFSLAQLPVIFQPESQLNCVFAEYKDDVKRSAWCTIFKCTEPPAFSVFNSARVGSVNGPQNTIEFVATIPDQTNDPAKGQVGPKGISTSFRGDGTNYWVVAVGKYSDLNGVTTEVGTSTGSNEDDKYDYAIVTTAAPEDDGKDGLCFSSGGMWFFTRDGVPPSGTKDAMEDIALGLRLDSSVLVDTVQTGCGDYGRPGILGGIVGAIIGFGDFGIQALLRFFR